jgi:hypothetical protein
VAGGLTHVEKNDIMVDLLSILEAMTTLPHNLNLKTVLGT